LTHSGPRRDRELIRRLVDLVAACAQWGPLLFVTDGLVIYIDAVRKAFRTRQSGTGGRPRLIPWPDLAIAQVVKQYAGRGQTPAMAAGISDHVWTVSELLHYRVPPPRWRPPRSCRRFFPQPGE